MKFEHFKKKLEAEKALLESELGTVGRKNPAVPNDWEQSPMETNTESDPIDQAGVVTDRENDAAVLADLESRYDAIIAALERIEKRTYGKCEVCGKEIKEERLEVEPSATACVEHL
jgi:RNA polymerase-binding transcription factor DksA